MFQSKSLWRNWIPSGAFCFCLLALSGLGQAADGRPRILSFANDNWLAMLVGEYKPGKGWIEATDFYDPPQPGDAISIFGVLGKLGEVLVDDNRRPRPGSISAGWSAHVSRGKTISQPYALAIQGSWPEDSGVPGKELALGDPAAVRIVAEYLKGNGFNVETPFITQAYQIDLDGDGRLETLLCAHSDTKALTDDQDAVIYALALLRAGPVGKEKTIALLHQVSHKPATQSIDEHEHVYGTRDFYRFLAVHDIDGDGRKEIVLYRAKDDASQIEVFTFNGHRKQKVLSAYKANYN